MIYLRNIKFILSNKFNLHIIFLIFLMILATFLEAFGISLVIPLLNILLDPHNMEFNKFHSFVFNSFNIDLSNQKIFFFILLPLFFLIKNLFLTFQLYFQFKTLYSIQAETAAKIYSTYLNSNYAKIMQINTSKIIQNTTAEISQFISALLSLLQLTTEFVIVIGIVILIFLVEPRGSLYTISFLVVFSYLFYFCTKNFLLSWGKKRQLYEGEKIKQLQQSFSLFKEIKLYNKEDFFYNKFLIPNTITANIAKWQNLLNSLPRLWSELLAVIALSLLLIYLNQVGVANSEMIPIVGLFTAAAFRLMPSANRILSCFQSIRFALPATELLSNILKEINNVNKNKNKKYNTKFENNILIQNLSFKYSNKETKTLNKINFEIKKSEIVGIMGESGSGKSTLVNILLGILDDYNGRIISDGKDIKYSKNWNDDISFVPQDVILMDATLKENIALGIHDNKINEKKILNILKLVNMHNPNLTDLENLNFRILERGNNLSGGQKQRIGIARALYRNAKIIIFDESTNALDNKTEKEILQTIKGLKNYSTILMVSHDKDTLSISDKIININELNSY